MNTENTETENITSIITEETGMTIAEPKRRKRVLKKAAEPSMKEAVELAEGKTLVIKEEKAEEKPNCGAGQPEPNWKQLYLELKEKTDPLLAKLEEQRIKRNEASKKSKKACRDKTKKVKTELEERVKKLEEKVLEKDFKEVLDEDAELEHKCADCDNHEDDITDENPLCADCRESAETTDRLFNTRHRVPTYCKKYEEEEKSDAE